MEVGVIERVRNEFEIRVFNESFERIRKSLDLIGDEELWKSPNEIIPSMGELIQHIIGNCTQWVCAGLFNQIDIRNRDAEFQKSYTKTKKELNCDLYDCEEKLKNCISTLSLKEINQSYTIQGITSSGFSVLTHVIEHTSYHTGQVTLLAKWYSNQQPNYYGGLDLNKSVG